MSVKTTHHVTLERKKEKESVIVSDAGTAEVNGTYRRYGQVDVTGRQMYKQVIGGNHLLRYCQRRSCWILEAPTADVPAPGGLKRACSRVGHETGQLSSLEHALYKADVEDGGDDMHIRAMCRGNVSWSVFEGHGKEPAPKVSRPNMMEKKALDLLFLELEAFIRSGNKIYHDTHAKGVCILLATSAIVLWMQAGAVLTLMQSGVLISMLVISVLLWIYADRVLSKSKPANGLSEPLLNSDGESQQLVISPSAAANKQTKDNYVNLIKDELDLLRQERGNVILSAIADLESDDPKHVLQAVMDTRIKLEVATDHGTWMSAYFSFYRVRVSYFFLVALSTLVACSCGILMELFFGAFANSNDNNLSHAHKLSSSKFIGFWLLPVWTLVLALFGDGVCDLILDTFDFPALTKLTSTMLGAFHGDDENPPPKLTCYCIDLFLVGNFEVLPLIFGFFGVTLEELGFFNGYCRGGIAAAYVGTFTLVACDMLIAVRDYRERDPTKIGEHRASQVNTQEAMDRIRISPGLMHSHRKCFSNKLAMEKRKSVGDSEALSRKERLGGWHGWASTGLLITLCVVWTLLMAAWYFGTFRVHADVIAACFFLLVAVKAVTFYLHFPHVVGPFFFGVLLAFLCMSTSLMLLSGQQLQAEDVEPIMTLPPRNPGSGYEAATSLELVGEGSGGGLPRRWAGNDTLGYLACDKQWGSKNAPLSALDLGELSWIAYERNCTDISVLLSQSFAEERRATMTSCSNYSALPRTVMVYFPSQNDAAEGTRVIAVKGTSTKRDIYTDTDLYATVQVLQFFSAVAPILSLLPLSQVQWMVNKFRIDRKSENAVFHELLVEVQDLMQRHPEDKFVFTGHSLGGSIAQVVAAKVAQPALVFSPPGITYSAKKFGVPPSLQTVSRNTLVVMPNKDVVPRCDLQAGLVQYIECRHKDGSVPLAVDCHSLEKTVCELWRVCGDDRDFSQVCDKHVDRKYLGQVFPEVDSDGSFVGEDSQETWRHAKKWILPSIVFIFLTIAALR